MVDVKVADELSEEGRGISVKIINEMGIEPGTTSRTPRAAWARIWSTDAVRVVANSRCLWCQRASAGGGNLRR